MHITASPTTLALALRHLTKNDPVIAELVKAHPHPRIAPHKNYYQELVESIISQQLSVKAAATILKRFIALYPGEKFPTPEAIIATDVELLRSVGLSRQKAGYIKDLAQKVLDETVRFNHLDILTNDEVIDELTKIKGVGIWTVHMFLLFCMGRLDVLPDGDLGIKNGVRKLYFPDETASSDLVHQAAEKYNWHPYESVASWYVWKSLDNEPVSS